jgi:hypothetical protein
LSTWVNAFNVNAEIISLNIALEGSLPSYLFIIAFSNTEDLTVLQIGDGRTF